jgi:hypothetical protein
MEEASESYDAMMAQEATLADDERQALVSAMHNRYTWLSFGSQANNAHNKDADPPNPQPPMVDDPTIYQRCECSPWADDWPPQIEGGYALCGCGERHLDLWLGSEAIHWRGQHWAFQCAFEAAGGVWLKLVDDTGPDDGDDLDTAIARQNR